LVHVPAKSCHKVHLIVSCIMSCFMSDVLRLFQRSQTDLISQINKPTSGATYPLRLSHFRIMVLFRDIVQRTHLKSDLRPSYNARLSVDQNVQKKG